MTTASPTAGPEADFAAVRTASIEPSRGLGIASLVLGLASIVAGFTFFVPVAGLVLGVLALRREPASRTMAIWGVVLNGVLLAGFVLVAVVAVLLGLALPILGMLAAV